MRALPSRLIALALTALAAAPAGAEGDEREADADSDLARAAVARGGILPLSVLLPRLAARFPSEVLDIELDLAAGGRIREYEFEGLTPEDRLIEVDMDAASGDVTGLDDEAPDDEPGAGDPHDGDRQDGDPGHEEG